MRRYSTMMISAHAPVFRDAVQAGLHCPSTRALPRGCIVIIRPKTGPLNALRFELAQVSIDVHAASMLHPAPVWESKYVCRFWPESSPCIGHHS